MVGAGNIGMAICITNGPVYGTIAAASLIVSGSIVVIGNTVHWIEKKGKCSDAEGVDAANSS